jgi:hemolysin activation/secretion protein
LRISLSILLLVLTFLNLNGQNYKLNYVLDSVLTDDYPSKTYSSKLLIETQLKQDVSQLIRQGYLTCFIDSLTFDSLITTAYINVGTQYSWARIEQGNVDNETLRKASFKEKYFENKPVSPKSLEKIFQSIIYVSENNGYPFASIKLDRINIDSSSISGSLNLERGKKITIDSVIIKGSAKINPTYIYNYLDITPNDIYNEKTIKEINIKLSEIPFIKPTASSEVIFFKNTTKITVFADKKKASKFNGIVGFLPNQTTGKLLITGDLELMLHNELGKGEKIDFNWRKLQNNVTDLKTSLAYPFILNTSFGAKGSFYLYRRDTLYQDINSKIDIQYILPGANHVGLFYENKTSRLINTSHYKNTNTIPSNLDIIRNFYGINLLKTKLDYRYNPRKGINIILSGSIGNRKILKNPNLNSEIYDSLKTNTTQYNLIINIDGYIPLGNNSTFNLGFQGSRLEAPFIFNNELFRIGGFKTLRGFDEESIFASTYSIATIEYRYIIEKNSFARLFIDGAYYEKKTANGFSNDFPFGFGLGFSFETKAGIFSLDYALGYQQQELAPIRSAKIHFGFVNYF